MNSLATAFLLINAAALLFVPRPWAPLPVLLGTCYLPFNVAIDLGPFTFTAIRILIAVGVARIILRREWPKDSMNGLDRAIIFWAAWAVFSSVFYAGATQALIFRLGFIYNACGVYVLFRSFCRSYDDIIQLLRITSIALIPIAVEMLYEQQTGRNLFFIFGGSYEFAATRDDEIRANGPFAHSILAGTVGAVCLPLMIGLWRARGKSTIIAIIACLAMILSSASSGPIMSVMAGIFALYMWRFRGQIRPFLWLAAAGYLALELVMNQPAYYIISYIDVVGGSAGWHRARLIESAFEHLSEWWLAGTTYTRHWMPTGVSWSPDHTDITNYYLAMGVVGGLPLMLLFIAVLVKGFSGVKEVLRCETEFTPESRFVYWALGSSLFVHAVTFVSVAYFDQSFVFLYSTLGAIGSAWALAVNTQPKEESPTNML